MINLHQRYNHYLNTGLKLNDHDINERIIAYGWNDDGKDIVGFYVLTETKELTYTKDGSLISIENSKVSQKTYAA